MKHRQKLQRLLLEGYGAGCTKKNVQIIIFTTGFSQVYKGDVKKIAFT